MPFRPKVNDIIQIDKLEYRFVEHPLSQGVPYTLAGEHSTVYQLQDEQGALFALKVFSLAYRSPQIATQALQLSALQSIPGLEACNRRVLIPVEQAELVIMHPELRYAVLMPWLPGRTLEELLSDEDAFTHEQRLMAAKKLAETLAQMEAQGFVHGNLNPANVLVDLSAPNEVAIHLVGLEGMRFDAAQGAEYDATSDRIAGAMLLAELLSGEVVREDIASQEHVAEIIENRWGRAICDLYERAVSSPTPADCPPFSEWITLIAKFKKRTPNETDNLISGIEKDLRKAQREVISPEQDNPRYIMNGKEAKVKKLAPTDRKGESPDLHEPEKKKGSKLIRFLSGWGGLFLFFSIWGIFIFMNPEVFFQINDDFPFTPGFGLETVVALIGICRIQSKQFTFSWGWLSVSMFIYIFIAIPTNGIPYYEYFQNNSFLYQLIAYEFLLMGYFLSINRFKASFSFKKHIPIYFLLAFAYILAHYFITADFITAVRKGNLFFPSLSSLMVFPFIILLAYYSKSENNISHLKRSSFGRIRLIFNIIVSVVIVFLLSFFIYIPYDGSCYSSYSTFAYDIPIHNYYYRSYQIPKKKYLAIDYINIWRNKMYIDGYYARFMEIMLIIDGSPAQEAGLSVGDLIISINGQFIDDSWEFQEIIQSNSHERLNITYLHTPYDRTYSTTILLNPSKSTDIGVVLSQEDRDSIYIIMGFIDSSAVTCN